jgi:hypothetical protein
MCIYEIPFVYVHLQNHFHICAFAEEIMYMRIYRSTSVYAHLWN